MKVYMLQDVDTGLYYKRRGGWVSREQAAVWTNKNGPSAVKGSHWGGAWESNTIVRTFKLEASNE